jgi:hypothetical protein
VRVYITLGLVLQELVQQRGAARGHKVRVFCLLFYMSV